MCPTRLEPRVAESEFYFQTALPSHAPASPPAGVQAWPSGARGPSSVQLAMRTLPHPHLLPSQQVPASCPTSPVATGFPPAGSAASEPGPSVYTSSFLPASRQAVHTPRSQASEILLKTQHSLRISDSPLVSTVPAFPLLRAPIPRCSPTPRPRVLLDSLLGSALPEPWGVLLGPRGCGEIPCFFSLLFPTDSRALAATLTGPRQTLPFPPPPQTQQNLVLPRRLGRGGAPCPSPYTGSPLPLWEGHTHAESELCTSSFKSELV